MLHVFPFMWNPVAAYTVNGLKISIDDELLGAENKYTHVNQNENSKTQN